MQECLSLARTRHRLLPEALTYRDTLSNGTVQRVLGDEDDLKAVVSNLVDNAIKYSGPEVRVAVELEQTEPDEGDVARARSGRRHLAAELKRIFKRFYRIPGAMATRIKGHRSRPFHRPLRRRPARRKGVRRERRAGHGSTFTFSCRC